MKKLEKLESIGATFQPLIPTCINWAWAHVRDPESRDNEAIFFWPCARRFDDEKGWEKREKRKKKRIINSNPLNHSSHLNGSFELEFSFPSPKLSFVHSREDRAASFSNCKFRVDKLSSRFVTRHSHGWRPVAFEKFLRDARARFLRFSFVLVWKKWMKLDASQCESLGLVRRIRTKGDNVWSLVPFWNYVQVWIHFWSMIMC